MKYLLGRTVVRWAYAAHEGALVNARVAATDCSRRRVERAEVDDYLFRLAAAVTSVTDPEAPGVAVVAGH